MSKVPSKVTSKAASKATSNAPQSSSSSRAPSSSQAPSSSHAPISQSSAPSRQAAATRLERDNIKSRAPGQCVRPSSQAPPSGAGSMAPDSMAPGGSSRVQTSSYAPGSSRVPGQSQRPGSMAPPTATRLVRDEVSLGSRVPMRADDESMELAKAMSSVRPGSSASKQTMDRIISHAPSAIATKLDRDNIPTSTISFTPSKTASRAPTQMAPSAPPQIPSILVNDYDEKMAKSQLKRDALSCERQREQDEWAIKKLTDTTGKACPDNRNWTRVEGGFLCGGYGHGFTDELINEGCGGLYAVGKGQHEADKEERSEDRKAGRDHRWGNTDYPNYWGQWDKWEGPFYYQKDANVGDGKGKGGYIPGKTSFKAAEGH